MEAHTAISPTPTPTPTPKPSSAPAAACHDPHPLTGLDNAHYLSADEFFTAVAPDAVTYDDVSLATQFSQVIPRQTDLRTSISESLQLQAPIISSDMDTVTESRMAIAMALNGGMGLIHYNMEGSRQVREVAEVKRHIHGLIRDPATIAPDLYIGDVLAIAEANQYSFSTFPVADDGNVLLGLLPGKVVRERYSNRTVRELMTPRAELRTINERDLGNDPIVTADEFFTDNPGTHKILVVNDNDKLCGLFTLSDIEQIMHEANRARKASRDASFRLIVGAAVAAVYDDEGALNRDLILEHISNLRGVGVDAVAVSSAHAFTESMGKMVRLVREQFPDLTIIAGNVTTGAGVQYLAECGASAIKVGQGPGSICTTRVVAGVGIPQLTALYIASRAAAEKGVRIIADGGINKSGDIVKALTLADAVMCGSMLAGCKEAPGELMEIEGKLYKQYRGMGSLAAMEKGSAARYGHVIKDAQRKLTAEGIEALKEVSGNLADVMNTLTGGVQSGMGYLGARNLSELKQRARFVRITAAGMAESRPHDVIEISKKTST
jgi:IMP dehydrogenase